MTKMSCIAPLNVSPQSVILHGARREELEFAIYVLLCSEFILLCKTSDKGVL